MQRTLQGLGLASAVIMSASPASAQTRADVNFAFGGATTNSASATDAFAVQNPQLQSLLAGIRAQGLNVIGLEQELTYATATLNDVDPDRDLFWVYAGTNNYLAGGQDPSVAPTEIGAALERLYTEVGARRFLVPNLPSLGDLPLFAGMPPEVQGGLTYLTVAHNQILAGVLADFAASHPGASVDTVDVFSIFQGHKVSGQFSNVSAGCDPSVPAAQLPVPGACDGFLYLDIVHPVSAAWAPVAQAAADAVAGCDVDRVITLGDSFSDVGSMSDTFLRTLGFPFPGAPFTEGRFTEDDNVVQQLETLLAAPVRATAFAQPYTATQTVSQTGAGSVTGSVFVPKTLSGAGSRHASVVIRFNANGPSKVQCTYRYAGNSSYKLERCNKRGVEGGDRVSASTVEVKLERRSPPVTVNWLYYHQ